jgi:signal transduction histidine kinase
MRLRKSIIIFFAFTVPVAALIISNAGARRTVVSSSYARRFPFRLEDVLLARITPNLPFFVADVDRDGNDDVLINEPDRLLWYRLHESRMTLVAEGAYERAGCTRMVADANGDGRPEFFVFTDTPEGPMLSCHDWFSPDGPSVPVYAVGPLFPPPREGGNPWRRTNFFGSFTAVRGGHPTILIGLNPRREEGPSRSLLAYDGVEGRRLWRFDFGPQSVDLACDDFGSRIPRVIFTTVAVANGISSNGTTDSNSYLFCLDERDGSLLWRKRLGGVGGRSCLALADIDADGRSEIIIARSLSPNDSVFVKEPHPWIVAALTGDGAVLFAEPLPVRPTSICAANLDGDPFPEMLVDGVDGTLFVLNHDLTIRSAVSPAPRGYSPSSRIYGVRDLTGDGKPEIVCWLDSTVVVRDHVGTIIAERNYAHKADVQLVRYDGKNYIAAAQGDFLHIMALKQLPFATRLHAHSRRLVIGAAVAVLIGVWAVFQVRRLPRWRRQRRISFDEKQNELLTAMSAFGHGGSSLKVLDRLRLHLKNWERIRSNGVTREELFARLHKTYRETIVPELRHLVMLARSASVPEGIWDTLLAEAKLAGKEMEAILTSSSEGAGRRNEHIAKALAALDTVDESIAGIRAHLRSVFRTPVAEAFDRLIARFRYEHGVKGISFALASDPSATDAVFISPVSFDKIFEALFSNAVQATEGKTGAEVVIAIQWEGDYCRIDVRDNGCGIPREDWERAFDRHYTTKTEGGGFGLYYAREELAKFGGKIYVLDSAAGLGTTIRVVLRKSEKAGAV